MLHLLCLTGSGLAPHDLAVESVRPPGNHPEHVPLADKGDEHPDTLQHVEGVCEVVPLRLHVFLGQGEAQQLKVPDDPHTEEQSEVEAYFVKLFPPLPSFGRFRHTFPLSLDDIDCDVDEHPSVEKEHHEYWTIQPKELVQLAVEETTPEFAQS